MLTSVSSRWNCTKIIRKWHIIISNKAIIWTHIAQEGPLLFHFFQNSCDNFISDFIAWNRTKFCMEYTYFGRWHCYNFCRHSLLGVAVGTVSPEFSRKCRSCVLLHEMAQKFMCKIYIVSGNNLYVYMCRCVLINRRRNYFAFFSEKHVIIVFQLILHEIVQNFAWNILTLEDGIAIIFAGIAC